MKYRFLKEKNQFYVVFDGVKYEVSEEVFHILQRSYENESKYEKRWGARSLSMDYEYDNGGSLADILVETKTVEPEDYVLKEEFYGVLKVFIAENLTEREQEILQMVILGEMTEQKYSDFRGCPRTTVNYQKRQILNKLRKFFEEN